MKHTTFYMYDEREYARMCAIAKSQSKTITQFLWDELAESVRRKYPIGSLEKFFKDNKPLPMMPPSVTDDKKAQINKFKSMPIEDLTVYDDMLDKHYTIFKKIYRGKRDD